MTKERLYIILLSIFIVSLIFRGFALSEKEIFSHDESISTLVATGNQGVYYKIFNSEQENELLNNWVLVDNWKFLVEKPEKLNFSLISTDLGNYDIHPPLYYWILHIVFFLFGSSIWAGAILNLVIYSATFIVVYLFFKSLKINLNTLLLTMFLWAFSPAVIHSVYEARHYELTALLSFILLFLAIKLIQSRNEKNILIVACIFVVSLAGILTNYMFSIVAGATVLIFIFQFYQTKAKGFLLAIASITLGLASILLVHPEVLNVFNKTGSDSAEIAAFLNTIHAYLDFFSADVITRYLTLVLILVLFISIFMNYNENLEKLNQFLVKKNTVIIVTFYVLIGGMIHLTYILNLTPSHSVGVQYWNMFWPLFAYLVALLFTQFVIKWKHFLVLALCLLMTYSLLTEINGNNYKLRSWNSEVREQIANADFIITDQFKRGFLPALIYKIPSEKNIYVNNNAVSRSHVNIQEDFDPRKVILISENIYESIVINDRKFNLKKIEKEIVYNTYLYFLSDI